MKYSTIATSSINFLKNLEKNNNRDWFTANKQMYLESQTNLIAFVDQLILMMNNHDVIENTSGKKSLYRIYNDIRFNADKLPYKPRFAFGLQRATSQRRGGYYVNIQPSNNFLACGFFSPNPPDLKRIRQDIEQNPETWRKLLANKKIREGFGMLCGNKVPTFPKGFPKEHEAIDLIRHKQFVLKHTFTDQEILQDDFMATINLLFKEVRPFFDYLSIVLTTDLNGESTI
jgi:uncharacterized protein (TIGR02453 family)